MKKFDEFLVEGNREQRALSLELTHAKNLLKRVLDKYGHLNNINGDQSLMEEIKNLVEYHTIE